jgi:MFS family permease
MAIGFGMFGLFLPLTIFLQSVLGLSPLQAGLTFVPMSAISMVVAPVAGRFADKVGGKWILFAGVSLFASGMGILIASSHLGVSRWHLTPGLIVAGFGLGMTFAPLQTVAMRNIQPRMAGAASGLINTTRQLGAVVGSAAVGALLESQLASKLGVAAQAHASAVPEQFRNQFVGGFSHASGNLEVGAGQHGITLPPGIPEQARQAIAAIAKTVFDTGFTNAMRATLWMPIGVMALAALTVLAVKRQADLAVAAPSSEEEAVRVGH